MNHSIYSRPPRISDAQNNIKWDVNKDLLRNYWPIVKSLLKSQSCS